VEQYWDLDIMDTTKLLSLFESVPAWAVNASTAIGLIVALRIVLVLLKRFYIHFLRPGKNLKKFGSWAIVTGSTDGIGKAIAEEFARKGLHLVLISRTLSKLQEQAKELETKYKVQTKVVAVDFSVADPAIFEPVKSAIQDLDVGILVNNVGASYDHAEYYLELPKGKVEQLIRLNIYSTTEMTNIVLPGMVDRKRGAIINLSSASSVVNEPLYAVYSATKSFVNVFSLALHYEYKRKGVHIQCQMPAFVTTKLSKLRSSSFFICTPRTYAKAFVNKIGYEPIVHSYWTHDLQISPATLLPTWLLSSQLLQRGLAIRSRALKKKAEMGKQQ